MKSPRAASPSPPLTILPAYTGVASLAEALEDPRAVRLLWLEILFNERLDVAPWGEDPAVRAASTKARRWYTHYRSLIHSLLPRAPLPHDPGPIDPREVRLFAEALRFVTDHD